MAGQTLTYIGGSDWDLSTTPVIYKDPRPIPKGLDWASMRPPEPTPEEAAIIRARAPKPARKQKRSGRAHRQPREPLPNAQEIVDDYTAGLTIRRLAVKYNHNDRTITRTLKGAGVVVSRRPFFTAPPELLEQIRHLYQDERLTIAEIEHQLGLSNYLVHRLMKDGAIETRCVPRKPRTRITDDLIVKVVDLRVNGGKTTRQIGNAVGLSPGAVVRIIRRNVA